MTGKERIRSLLRGDVPDSLPHMSITMMAAADCIGEPYGTYATDFRILARGQAAIADRYGIDHVSVISDPAVEAHDYGAAIVFYDDQPPAVDERAALLAEKATLSTLKPLVPGEGKRMTNRIRGVEELKRLAGNEKLIEGWIEGPCAEASDLRGINHVMLDLLDDPAFIRDLFELTTSTGIEFARAQVEAGADIIGVGDAAASLVGPALYDQFVWPYEKRIVDAVHEMGALARLHICGNVTDILEGMGKLGFDILDIDSLAPFDKARRDAQPGQVLCGNIDPVRVLRNGTPDYVREEIELCFNQAQPFYIVGAGCEVPRDTPEENFTVLNAFARSHTAD